jgi:DNA-binding response OmpR family regulator
MAKRVLIVDDDATTRSVVRAMLETDKSVTLNIVEAATGAQCLKAVEAGPMPDLILLDVMLPDTDGFTLCKAMRTHGVDCAIVFLTSKTEHKDYLAGRDAGGDSYLTKPPNRAAVRSVVHLFTNLEKRKAGA